MLDTDTKRKIDEARDILVGKVPVPNAQVEQITIALIYKFMDDMDKEVEMYGGKPKFFTGEFAGYAWNKIFNPQLSGNDIVILYGEAIEKMNHNPNIPELFRNIFKNAYLPFRDPETLKRFLKIINEFKYTHSEDLGDAYEYLLSILGSQGDAGQFRTPRHIIEFIVEAVNPQKTNKILDPACGTAGFLISSYKHIVRCNTEKTQGDKLTPEDKRFLADNLTGYDISPEMVKISLVNMYLHNFPNPKIYEYDTLTSEDKWNEYFDVILANPPFMSPKGGIRPHKRFSIKANRSEVLFVDYIAEHLLPSGKAGVIVPEGIIFQASNAYKELRKMLVDNYLWAVVSLPAGVFNPYSGVKTSILLMDRTLAKTSDKILFLKIENDGYDLGAQRRKIDKDDLPSALEILKEYKSGTLKESADRKPDYLIVPKQKIYDNPDYNLSFERYRENGIVKSKYNFVNLGEVCNMYRGITFSKKDQLNYEDENTIKIATTKAAQDWGIDYDSLYNINKKFVKDKNLLLRENDILISIANSLQLLGRVTLVKKINFDISFGAFMGLIRAKENLINPIFLYYILKSKHALDFYFANARTTTNISNTNFSILKTFNFPLPPLDIQKEIVNKIESYQKIIDGAKQVIENYKPEIEINYEFWSNSKYNFVNLGEVCNMYRGITFSKKDQLNYEDEDTIKIATTKAAQDWGIDYDSLYNINKKFVKDKNLLLRENDILISIANSLQLLGRVTLVKKINFDISFGAFMGLIRAKENLINPIFLYYILKSKHALDFYFANARTTTNISNINFSILKTFKIPLPTIEEQQKIVERIENEQKLIAANKQLVEIYEQKIKDEINKVWDN